MINMESNSKIDYHELKERLDNVHILLLCLLNAIGFHLLWKTWHSRWFHSAYCCCTLHRKSFLSGSDRVPEVLSRKYTNGGYHQGKIPGAPQTKIAHPPEEDRFSHLPAIFPASIGAEHGAG